MTTILEGTEGLRNAVGRHLGYSGYIPVTQSRINAFAEATGDRQWIHVDEERAKQGPYGKTIAHGLLTLAMIGDMAKQVFSFKGFNRGVNYGYEKIRFPTIVPVGSRVRVGAQILKCEDVPGGVQTTMELTTEVEGADKPACVAQMIFRHFV